MPTMKIPMPRITRSPTRSTSQPAGGEDTNRVSAKIEMTALAANAETPKSLANSGMTGKTMPKPTATAKATAVSTATSRGMPRKVDATHSQGRATRLTRSIQPWAGRVARGHGVVRDGHQSATMGPGASDAAKEPA